MNMVDANKRQCWTSSEEHEHQREIDQLSQKTQFDCSSAGLNKLLHEQSCQDGGGGSS